VWGWRFGTFKGNARACGSPELYFKVFDLKGPFKKGYTQHLHIIIFTFLKRKKQELFWDSSNFFI
jgi:hypothetical protein